MYFAETVLPAPLKQKVLVSRDVAGEMLVQGTDAPLTAHDDGLIATFSNHAAVRVLSDSEQVRVKLAFPPARIHLDVV